jgi:hypothetical protein
MRSLRCVAGPTRYAGTRVAQSARLGGQQRSDLVDCYSVSGNTRQRLSIGTISPELIEMLEHVSRFSDVVESSSVVSPAVDAPGRMSALAAP